MKNHPSTYDELLTIVQGSADEPGASLRSPGLIRKLRRVIGKLKSPALTMCGPRSLSFLQESMATVLDENIPGDFIEAGVWRGGIPLLMRGYLHFRGISDRRVWLADSFEGLPRGWQNIEQGRDRLASIILGFVGHLSVPEAQVISSFKKYGLWDDQVQIVKGWFRDTLPVLSPEVRFSVVRLDGDYFESTRDALSALYPRLSAGGYLIVDDYNLPFACKKAVDEYRLLHEIKTPLHEINGQSVYWRKEMD